MSGERIADARLEIERVRLLLLEATPAAIDQCAEHLERGASALRVLERDVSDEQLPVPGLRCQLLDLRRELDRVGKLLQAGSAWHLGWARIVASADGYTQAGTLVGMPAAGRVSLQG